MTRKKVDEALARMRAADAEGALTALSGVTLDFVRRRLAPQIGVNGAPGAPARVLWSLLGLHPPVALQEGDSAPQPAAPPPPSPRSPRLVRFARELELERPESFLSTLPDAGDGPWLVDLDDVLSAQVWSLVGLAALGRRDSDTGFDLVGSRRSPAAHFAHAIGLAEVLRGAVTSQAAEQERTFPIQRITRMEEIERAASRISTLMIRADEDARRTLYYVLVELLRNVVQHSQDPVGGVVAAQRMDARQGYPRPVIQVAVGDAGIGILSALQVNHPELDHAEAALTKALEPHISGTFGEGRSGSRYNAGMGLFFISEMAKLTAGRLVVATRGAALYLRGDLEGRERHDLRFVKPTGTGFPGTLVAFELPLDGVGDHDALIETIRQKAYVRTPRATSKSWLILGEPPPTVARFAIEHLTENTIQAEALAREELQRRILARTAVALDFRGIEVCTQSFLHALLYETLRLAWAMQVEVFATNAAPAVTSGLKLVENYALAG